MASTSAFSSPAKAAIQRSVELNEAGTSLVTTAETAGADIAQIYELDDVARELVERGFKTIALQFPDELLHDAVPVYRALKQRLPADAEAYVLADTSYGSCCVDEVAAQHVDADVVVHFGHACLSRTSRLPVLYVFGRRLLDAEHAVATLLQTCTEPPARVKLLYDVAYAHAAEQLRDAVRAALPNAQILWTPPPPRFWPPGPGPGSQSNENAAPQEGPSAEADTGKDTETVLFYVGAESLALSTVLMTHALMPAYSFDPTTRIARAESRRTNAQLARRYALVHRARAADVFGIVVGTLGVASYLPLITHLRTALSRARKKSYTLAVGKLSPAKLANFADVGAFVLVACAQTSLVDSRDYLAPVVTPFELLLALAPGEPADAWTGDYALDFARLLAMPLPAVPSSSSVSRSDDGGERDAEEDVPQYDFTTGKLRSARRFDSNDAGTSTPAEDGDGEGKERAVVVRSGENALTLASVGAGFLQDRHFKGLEVNAGRDAPSVLEQGRSGIARGYDTVAEVRDPDSGA